MRRSIDDYPFQPSDLPAGDEDAKLISWGVAVSDDYDDAEPRIVLTIDEIGHAGEGMVGHFNPAMARRLRKALFDGLKEIGQDPGQ
jgi:hypothetical protein